MLNTFLTPKIIAQEALMVLENQLTMANLVHRDYSKEFVKVGDSITIRKPARFSAKNFTAGTQPEHHRRFGSCKDGSFQRCYCRGWSERINTRH